MPEGARRECVPPPSTPAFGGTAVDADNIRQSLQPGDAGPVLQDRDQHDDSRDIDPAAKESQRRRRLSAPATIDRTTEAEALVVLGAKTTPPAARLARISGRVQATAALFATFGSAIIGQIAIAGEQEVVESGIGQ